VGPQGDAVKYLNGLAWIVTIVVVAGTLAYWSQIKWAWQNRDKIKTAADTVDGLNQLGVKL
jgi:predicted ribosomally synthesized peptide with SipW-like signal peptide